jgi:hypothetical protein
MIQILKNLFLHRINDTFGNPIVKEYFKFLFFTEFILKKIIYLIINYLNFFDGDRTKF